MSWWCPVRVAECEWETRTLRAAWWWWTCSVRWRRRSGYQKLTHSAQLCMCADSDGVFCVCRRWTRPLQSCSPSLLWPVTPSEPWDPTTLWVLPLSLQSSVTAMTEIYIIVCTKFRFEFLPTDHHGQWTSQPQQKCCSVAERSDNYTDTFFLIQFIFQLSAVSHWFISCRLAVAVTACLVAE